MARGKAEAAVSRIKAIGREMAERRALRERNAASVRKRSRESLLAQGKVAAKAAEHLGELGRRRKQAGGWNTEKSLSGKIDVMGFGAEDEQREATFSHYGTGSASPPPAPSLELPEARREPPQPRRARHARQEDQFDDDDFSNSSWLK
ncbi:hypothetical protein BAY61_02985 [Prauserella marina]|uniref:Uncharacterized protein n=2 Tax=Prauserella marina TaxID=530584 RepID=A0A222VYA9_9PSEU|nr:hypothetical protein BAY61_02985 [Prauserella marina]PWV82772.1 hypothetical protein DES30_1021019 [Prauserella marina]SDC76914.1 hypothetical protein SAMN05421630_103555 [Prauserella marina]